MITDIDNMTITYHSYVAT